MSQATLPTIDPIPDPPILRWVRFTRDHSSRVSDFRCARPGASEEERWERYVSDWIRSEEALGFAMTLGTVWLVETEAGELIGYASLGRETWDLTVAGISTPVTVTLFAYLAVQTSFQNQPPPPAPKEHRFARRIFSELIERATTAHPDRIIGLYVDPDNPARTRFYPAFGFAEAGEEAAELEPNAPERWVRMIRPPGPLAESRT